MSDLSVSVVDTSSPSVKIVVLIGEMDEPSLQDIKLSIDPVLDNLSIRYVVFDLTQLQFINSKGIGYFVAVHSHLSKNQRKLVLAGATEAVMDVISLVGLTSIIQYNETVDEALQTTVQ